MFRNHKGRITAILSCVFFFSGFSSLIYQVVWQRLLTLHYGVASISTTIIVSAFMLGLGLGALVGGNQAERINNKIHIYFLIELGIGVFGLLSMPFLNILSRWTAGSSYIASFFSVFAFLFIPTFLMGMTLPILTKIYNRLIKNFGETVSFLYFINTAGAALGALISSYCFISFWGLDVAIYVAAGINFILAGLVYGVKTMPAESRLGPEVVLPEDGKKEGRGIILGKLAYPLVLLTGFLAVGYEITWFRIVGVLIKASPYAFSTVLFVYLMGIAWGSGLMHRFLQRNTTVDRKELFFRIQFWIGMSVLAILVIFYFFLRGTELRILIQRTFLQNLHPLPEFFPANSLFWTVYQNFDVLLWPLFFVFIPTLLMGAGFPLIALLALSRENEEGRTIGSVYFFNVMGNVLGGLVTGFFLLPILGTGWTVLLFAAVGISFVFLLHQNVSQRVGLVRLAAVLIILVLSASFLGRKGELYFAMHSVPYQEHEVYFEEGVEGVVLTLEKGEIVHNYINGLQHGGRPLINFYYQMVEALNYIPRAKDTLIIGFGTGSFTEAAIKAEDVKKVTLVEINGTLLKNLNKMKIFKNMLDDVKVDLIIDDGRRLLLRTDQKFDLITLDPLRSTTSHSNNLYSKEFFELIYGHLRPGGVFMVWFDEYYMIPKTLTSVFPWVRMYGDFCLASNQPFENQGEKKSRLMKEYPQKYQQAMREYDKERYLGDQDFIRSLTNGLPVNKDLRPNSEFYLGIKAKYKKRESR